MRTALRVIAAVNGVFQVLVGLLCTVSPTTAATIFELTSTGPSVLALTRMFGGLLFGSGLTSLLVARSPERNPDLLLLLIASCVVNVSADAMVVSHGEMPFKHLAGGVILQVILIVLALGTMRRRA